jgi:hypothetical protein
MSALEAVRAIVTRAQETLDLALGDAPAEVLNQVPPGTANPIGAIVAHAVFNLDTFYNVGLLGQAHLLTTGGYADQLGLPGPDTLDWDVLKAARWEMPALRGYAQAVAATAGAYLAALTEAELGQTVSLFGHEMTVTDVLALAAWHTALHAGEIAALRGVGGARGLPF